MNGNSPDYNSIDEFLAWLRQVGSITQGIDKFEEAQEWLSLWREGLSPEDAVTRRQEENR